MSYYDDGRIRVDDTHAHIRSLRRHRRIAICDIREVTSFDTSRWGTRLRLVGIGLERPRTWFMWDPERHTRQSVVELDVGRRLRIGVTPADPQSLLAVLDAHPARQRRH